MRMTHVTANVWGSPQMGMARGCEWGRALYQSGIVLNLLRVPHVLQMDVVVPMTRGTKHLGRHMFSSAPNVRDSHAGNNIASHG